MFKDFSEFIRVRTVQLVRRLGDQRPRIEAEASNRATMGEPAVKVKADDIAAVFREEIRADVAELKAKGVHPTLVSFLATGDVAAKKYSEWTQKACEADGIKYEVREVSGAHEPRAMPPSGPMLLRESLRALSACSCTKGAYHVQVDKTDLEEALNAANHDPNVHGILIYYPCFGAAPSFYGVLRLYAPPAGCTSVESAQLL